jgi:DUF4097 and DUF4098 domain-containing protein YvlB
VLIVPKGGTTVHVPERLQVSIRAPKAEVSVIGLKSSLAIEPGTGEVSVQGHAGSLSVARLEEGEMNIDGLLGTEFSLSAEAGDISLGGLRLRSGRGSIQTQEGSVSLGVMVEDSAFAYEARTVSGTVTASVGVLESRDHYARGQVGERGGGGQVTLSTGTGDLDVRSHDSMLRSHAWSENWWWVVGLGFAMYWWLARGEIKWWIVMTLMFSASSSLWYLVRWRRRRE